MSDLVGSKIIQAHFIEGLSFFSAIRLLNRDIVNRDKQRIFESITECPKLWIEKLPKAIIIYNNTKHSTTGKSPSDMILTEKYLIGTKIPVNRNVVTWKEGHPEYSPRRIIMYIWSWK